MRGFGNVLGGAWGALVLVALVAFSLAPDLHFRQAAGGDWVFMGFPVVPQDHIQYGGFIAQARDDHALLLKNEFTPEPQEGRYVFLNFTLAGLLARVLPLDIPVLFTVFRLVFVLGLFALMVQVFRRLLGTPTIWPALALFFLGGGTLGWFAALAPSSWTSAPIFSDALQNPWSWFVPFTHFIGMWVPSLLLSVGFFSLAARQRTTGTTAALCLLALLIYFLHPYTGIFVFFQAGLAFLFETLSTRRPPWGRYLPLAIPALVILAYLFWAHHDQVFAITAGHTFRWKNSYSPLLWPLAYGPLLLLAAASLPLRQSSASPLYRQFLLAALAGLILSVNPFMAGVKFQMLFSFFLAILAAAGFQSLLTRVSRPRLLATAVLLFALCDSLLGLGQLLSDQRNFKLMYLRKGEVQALDYLRQRPAGVTMSDYAPGLYLPWKARKTSFVSHWFLTIDYFKKGRLFLDFFGPAPLPEKEAILRDYHIRYILFSRFERPYGAVDPRLPVTKVFENPDAQVFEVTPPPPP